MDCGELRLQQFETDAERAQWLDEARERMGLPKPTVVEIKESQVRFSQEMETARLIQEGRERGLVYVESPNMSSRDGHEEDDQESLLV